MPSDRISKPAGDGAGAGAGAAVERPPLPPVLMGRIGFLLAMTKGGAETIVSTALDEIGIYPRQYGVMLVLATEGPVSQGELAEWVRTDRTTMVALVDGLEERGYVRRERNPADRRAYRLQLTADGKRALTRGRALMRRAENELLRSLDSKERARLVELLGKVAVDVGRPPGDHIDNAPRG
jgi:MarR family transcriptional regulator, lower aerobic nicotinate degradation pathway regulator